jgi:hypothetical protein
MDLALTYSLYLGFLVESAAGLWPVSQWTWKGNTWHDHNDPTGLLHTSKTFNTLCSSKGYQQYQYGKTSDYQQTTHIEDSPLPQTTAAAKSDKLTQQLEMLDVTLNILEPAVAETLPLGGTHETLGLITWKHPEHTETIVFWKDHSGTVCLHNTIWQWKSRLKGLIVVQTIDDMSITYTDAPQEHG